jgi:hypothetical protein
MHFWKQDRQKIQNGIILPVCFFIFMWKDGLWCHRIHVSASSSNFETNLQI